MQTPLLSPKEKHQSPRHSTDQPQQRIHQIHPDSILHSLNASVAFRVLVNVQLAEEAEQSNP